MKGSGLLNLRFDKGNGALFEVESLGQRVRCFLPQASTFLARKAGSARTFPDLIERYERLVAVAALVNIARVGVNPDQWGNCVEDQDLDVAQASFQGAI